MLKRLLLLAGLLSLVTTSAQAAGTIAFSLSQQLDQYGNPLSGCQLYTIQAGTTSTPQNAYKDTALTLPQPNPMTCDAAGRLPQFFLADGQIKIRLTDKFGVPQVVADNILVIGPSGGGGGGGTVDPTTIAATGDMKVSYGTGTLGGWVRANGRTIGSATSGATERANADTQALFQYLWTADPNLTVSGGRGANSLADWTANKAITLPDYRGRVIAGLDDMGNSAAGRLSASYFGATATTLGASGGAESTTLTLPQLPTGITSTGSASVSVSISSNYFVTMGIGGGLVNVQGYSSGAGGTAPQIGTAGTFTSASGSGSVTATSNNTSGSAHRTVQPTILSGIYIKL
jgi:hypothetical protein